MDNLLSKFKKLVEIYSPSGGEKAISEYLEQILIQLGFETYTDRQRNILARRGNIGKPVMFCAHMDTVEPSENIRIDIHKGIVNSDGRTILGADNKIAIATILEVVEKIDPNHKIEILFTVKEESGGGLTEFPFDGIESETCFIFDSVAPIGTIISESPNIINFKFKILGKSAHISESYNGINAMLPATYIVQNVGRIQTSDQTIINIGKFVSGDNTNAIPGFATIQGEIRSYDDDEFVSILDQLEEMNNKVKSKFLIESKLEIQEESRSYGYSHTREILEQSKIFEIYNKLNIKPEVAKSWAVSDANTLNHHGILTINLGDGVVNAHTTEESISLESIERMYEIIKTIIERHES